MLNLMKSSSVKNMFYSNVMAQITIEYVVCYVPDNIYIFPYNAKVACPITEV